MLDELMEKEERVRALLRERRLDAVLLRRVSSFAWITGGAASYVSLATEVGPSIVLVTLASKLVLTNNIEAERLRNEALLEGKGFELLATPWYVRSDAVSDLTDGLRLGCDGPYPDATDLSEEISSLRARLLPSEIQAYRAVGLDCAQAIEESARCVRPEMSEYAIAGLVAERTYARGVVPVLTLVAVDRRVHQYRHPLPTNTRLKRYAMLVLGGQRHGLVASVTRLIHFGPVPADLRRRADAVAHVDAVLIASTRPGALVARIFGRAQQTYAETGYSEEWKLLHQGGGAGYESREYKASFDSKEIVQVGQAFAWNPSVCGVKSEDTLIVHEESNEIITATGAWPQLEVRVDDQYVSRPAILEL